MASAKETFQQCLGSGSTGSHIEQAGPGWASLEEDIEERTDQVRAFVHMDIFRIGAQAEGRQCKGSAKRMPMC